MIGIDGNEANVTERVGSNVYAHQLLKALVGLSEPESYQIYLKRPPLSDLPSTARDWQYRVFGPGKLWTQWRLPLDLYWHQPRPHVFFTPGHYAPRFSPIPTVITILDLAFLYYPEALQPRVLAQLKNWTEYSVKQASHILAISENTKQDVIKEYGVDPDKISVTYLASNIEKPAHWRPTQIDQIKHRYQINTPYFLFTGTRQPRKNLERLLKAFRKLHGQERNISLVITGKTWHQFNDVNITASKNVIFSGYVPDTDLVKLMLGAEAFVFPSLYEGFGMPVLEAMSLGTLVTASSTSSIPEITGESPLLFDPLKEEAIFKSLKAVLHMEASKKRSLIRQAKIRSELFSWERCARETLAVLRQVREKEA